MEVGCLTSDIACALESMDDQEVAWDPLRYARCTFKSASHLNRDRYFKLQQDLRIGCGGVQLHAHNVHRPANALNVFSILDIDSDEDTDEQLQSNA